MRSVEPAPAVRRRLIHASVVSAVVSTTFAAFTVTQSVTPDVAAETIRAAPGVQGIAAKSATMRAAEHVRNSYLDVPRPLTAQQIARSLEQTDALTPSWAARRAATATANPLAGPTPGTEVVPRTPTQPSSDVTARLREQIVPLNPVPFGLAVRMVAEPAVALGGSVIWATGNWFAARSADGGATWRYVDPYADFPTFTSDQDAVFDPYRRLFLWYRQGGAIPGTVENSVRLNVSGDGASSWCGYNLRPTELNPDWARLDFDYPHLALTNDYLYITTTLLINGGGITTPRMVLLRLSLDALSTCGSFQFDYWTMDEGWVWAPVDSGTSTVMYLGDTFNSGGPSPMGFFRVYAQPEFSTTLYYVDREVPAWTFSERTGLCPVLGGGNPCTRTDQRITSGWVRRVGDRGEIGFLWNVRDGGGFPYPYIDAVTFDQATLQVTGRPMLWDSNCAWQYGAAAVSSQNELGISAFYLCGSLSPAHAVGFRSAGSGRTAAVAGAPWRLFYARIGGAPTTTQIWGDYIRVRSAGAGFVATGYTLDADGPAPFLVPFGRATLR